MSFTVKGSVSRDVTATANTEKEAVAKWQRLAGGGYPDWIHEGDDEDTGLPIIGGCEGCGRPIREGEKYSFDDDGCVFDCIACMKGEAE